MKLNDEKTRSVAAAVSDVLEGKNKMKKEEVKYPHKMYSKDGKDEVEVKDKAEHDKYAAKGYVHEKPEVNEVEEPRAKGEKDFKAKHVIKKSGENNDGTVTKEGKKVDEVLGFDKDNPHKDEDEKEKEKKEGNAFTKALNAARKNGDDDFVVSGKKYKVEDYDEEEDEDEDEVEERSMTPMRDKFGPDKNLVKKAVALATKMGGNMTGAVKKIEKMQKGLSKDKDVAAALRLANEEVEAKQMNEAEDKKTKYRKFFDKALKKFGVSSPAELKGDKKKEFFDYVDANYEAENETD